MDNPSGRDPKRPVMKPISDPISRGRGCYNCTAWENQEKARSHWSHLRQNELQRAFLQSQMDPDGEKAQIVVNIRRMVDNVDRTVAAGVFGVCLKGKGNADLVHNAFLCDSWNGREGASIATAGHPIDELPGELKDKKGLPE